MSENVTPFDIFCWGVDDFNCYFVARKTAMPSNPTPRRQPHSDKWREAKRKGWENFKNYCAEHYGGIK